MWGQNHTCALGLSGVCGGGGKGPFAYVGVGETHMTFIWDQHKKRDK